MDLGIGTGSWRFYKYGKMMGESPVVELDSGDINYQLEENQPGMVTPLRHLTSATT